jgi:hypothetical protein
MRNFPIYFALISLLIMFFGILYERVGCELSTVRLHNCVLWEAWR